MTTFKPRDWNVSRGPIAPKWHWFWRNCVHAHLADRILPFDHARGSPMTQNNNPGTPTHIATSKGMAFAFNTGARSDRDHWAVPDSTNNLLEGLNTFTLGMYLRTNYGTTSTNEDSLFGHWDNINGAGSQRKKFLFRWDSNTQNFECFASSDGTTDQNIGTWSAASFDDGEWHVIVVTAQGGSVTAYMDGRQIGTGSFTGTISSGANSHDWECPGGHQVTFNDLDTPRIDLLAASVTTASWSVPQVIQYTTNPFGPLGMIRGPAVRAPLAVAVSALFGRPSPLLRM